MGTGVIALDFLNDSTAIQQFFRAMKSSTLSAPSEFRFFVLMTPVLKEKRSDCACGAKFASTRSSSGASMGISWALLVHHLSVFK